MRMGRGSAAAGSAFHRFSRPGVGYSPSDTRGEQVMRSYLAGLAWPLGLAVIFAAAFLMARRVPVVKAGQSPRDDRPHRSHRVPEARWSSRDTISAAVRFIALACAG